MHVRDQRAAADPVCHFRDMRTHAGALAGGKNDRNGHGTLFPPPKHGDMNQEAPPTALPPRATVLAASVAGALHPIIVARRPTSVPLPAAIVVYVMVWLGVQPVTT